MNCDITVFQGYFKGKSACFAIYVLFTVTERLFVTLVFTAKCNC